MCVAHAGRRFSRGYQAHIIYPNMVVSSKVTMQAMSKKLNISFIIKELSKSNAIKYVMSFARTKFLPNIRRICSGRFGLRIIPLISIVTTSCAVGTSVSQLDYLIQEPGDRVTYLSSGRFFGLEFVTVRNIQKGEFQVDPRNVVDLDLSLDKESITPGPARFKVLVHPDLVDNVRAFSMPLAQQINQSLDMIRERELLPPGYSANVVIRLVPLNSGFEYKKTHFFFDRPTFEFVSSIDVRSMDRFEFSLISTLETVHHELIHFSADLGWIDFPGQSVNERFINEEAFATIVGRCDALNLYNDFHGDRPRLRYKSRRPKTIDLDGLRASPNRADSNVLGRIIGLQTFLEEMPKDRYLDSKQLNQALNHCATLSRRPTDLVKRYFERY